MAPTGFEARERTVQPLNNRSALVCPDSFSYHRTGSAFPQLSFDPIQMLDLAQEPSGCARRFFQRFVNLSSHVSPATRERHFAFAIGGKGPITEIAIALHGPSKIDRNDLLQTRRRASGFPVVEHVTARSTAGPEVALLGFTIEIGRASCRE